MALPLIRMEILVGDVASVEDEQQPEMARRADGSFLVDDNIAVEHFRASMNLADKLSGEGLQAYQRLAVL